jgi:hypothetical protein
VKRLSSTYLCRDRLLGAGAMGLEAYAGRGAGVMFALVLSEVAPASISLGVGRHGEVPLRGLKDGQDGYRAAEEL